MSHPGRTERKEEASSQEKEEDGKREQDLYQPRSLFPNRIQQAPRSELFMSTNAYGLVGQASFRGNDGATRNVDYTQRLHNNPSNEFLGPGLGFENREFTAIGDSFELDDFNLGIDENEPTPNFPVARNLQGSNESRAFPPQRMPPENITGEGRVSSIVPNDYERQYILSLYAHGSCLPKAQDEGMDRKPAAMDPTLHPNLQQLRNQHQQYYHPNQQAMHPLELFFNTSMNRPLQNQQAQREVAEQIALPVASLTRGSAKAPRRTKRNLKPPPEASFPRQSPRRSKRITANSTRKKASPKKSPDKKKASPKRAQPRTLQVKQWSETRKAILQEARTQRQSDALHTWFERLGDLQEFIDEQGHGKISDLYYTPAIDKASMYLTILSTQITANSQCSSEISPKPLIGMLGQQNEDGEKEVCGWRRLQQFDSR